MCRRWSLRDEYSRIRTGSVLEFSESTPASTIHAGRTHMSLLGKVFQRNWWVGWRIALLAGALSAVSLPLPAGADDRPVSFVNDVMPVLTKAGCNAGVCHAKAGGGQNGFQLSLLGFETLEDFEHLVK